MRGRLTVLGSGTSTGVPMLGCACAVCASPDPRDRRLRPSVWLRFAGHSVLFDTTPDFRTQALRAGVAGLDAVFFTHSHADHVMGMDDVRPLTFGMADGLPLYANAGTLADLRRIYRYAFADEATQHSKPRIRAVEISGPIEVGGVRFEPLPVLHGTLEVLGYRFGRNAYVTDFSVIPPATMERLRGLDVLILDALRLRPHPTHSHLENSLRLARELLPARTYFTHIAHEMAHGAIEATLPPEIRLAYDGLELDLDLGGGERSD